MNKIILKNITKQYGSSLVLKGVTCSFPEHGFIGIVGKSGCGKSTLLSIIAGIEKPTSGDIYINSKNRTPGYVFQSYNLLENESGLFNVMLPFLIDGVKPEDAQYKAKLLLSRFDISESTYIRKTKNLSGGEKQRIGIARAYASNPDILLADEPTGAIDKKRSIKVMELLKEISKEHLVIMVSHNEPLLDKYADKKMRIVNGVLSESLKGELPNIKENKKSKKDTWSKYFLRSNLKRRRKRNFLIGSCISISLLFSMLALGFSFGKSQSVYEAGLQQIDIGNVVFYSQKTKKISGSNISLTQVSKPTQDVLEYYKEDLNGFYIENNYDSLFNNSSVEIDSKQIDNYVFSPVYDYSSIKEENIIQGMIQKDSSSECVYINRAFSNEYKIDIDSSIKIKIKYTNTVNVNSDALDSIIDNLIIEKTFKIGAICEDFMFLSKPKIYYSFVDFESYLQSIIMNNLSKYEDDEISWYDYILQASPSDAITSYSYRLFSKQNDYDDVKKIVALSNENVDFSAESFSRISSLQSLTDAMTYGLDIFTVIALLGSFLIMGIMSFSSFIEDTKNRAIIYVLGAKKEHINSVYVKENLLTSFIALLISIGFYFPFSFLTNKIVFNYFSFSNIINIPLVIFVFAAVIVFLIVMIFTYVPVYSERKKNIVEVLREE